MFLSRAETIFIISVVWPPDPRTTPVLIRPLTLSRLQPGHSVRNNHSVATVPSTAVNNTVVKNNNQYNKKCIIFF